MRNSDRKLAKGFPTFFRGPSPAWLRPQLASAPGVMAGAAGWSYFSLSVPSATGRRDEQHTKTVVVAALLGKAVVAESRAAVLTCVIPRTAPKHALAAGASERVFHGAGLVIVRVVE